MTTKKTFGKRALSLLLTLLMVISLVPVSLFSASAAEVETAAVGATVTPYDGVPVTPTKITSSNYQSFGLTDSNWSAFDGYYAIRNAKELYGFANLVNGGDRYINAVLLHDIVVNETVSASGATYEWVSIGASSDNSFMGTFDGNGCTISGLYCNYITATGVGLFGTIGTAAQTNSVNIKNVVLANSYISGSNGLGGIVGRAIGYGATISNCVVSEDVMVVKSIDSATPYTGGIIGQYDGLASSVLQKYNVCCTVSNCVNLGTVQIMIRDFTSNIAANRHNIGSITGAYATEDNDYEFIDVNNCYYLSGHLKDKNGNSLKADGTVVDIGKGGGSNRLTNRDCTILSSASDSHTCVSVNHTEVKATCLYSGLSEYSECLICGAVMSGAKIVYGIDYENHASIDVIYENIDTANHKVYHNCCGVLKTTEKHNFNGKATCNTAVTCNNCGGVSDLNKDNHTGNLKYTYKNETHHSVSYSCCGAFVEDKEHTYSGGNCVTKEVCEICKGEGSICTDIHASTEIYWNVVSKDHTKHAQYHKCCDAEIENTTAEHEFEDSICRICRYECEHPNMDDGICTDCGENSVKYLDRTWNGTTVVTTEKKTNGMPTTVTSDTTTMSNGWYIVYDDVNVNSRITISGTVFLILANGSHLIADKGIDVTDGNSLYIYAQTDDVEQIGRLTAYGTSDSSSFSVFMVAQAAIGSGTAGSVGTIVINGGIVTANGTLCGSGIGSGYKYKTGNTTGSITINGGTVTAIGGKNAAGIGAGYYTGNQKLESLPVNIHGGTVTATGGENAAGIGGGMQNSGGTVIITGGNVKAVAGSGAEAIGKGYNGSKSGILTDNNGNYVYLNTITLEGVTEQKAVTEVNGVESYGLNDVKTLDTNMLYFYLPETDNPTSLYLENDLYTGALTGTTEKTGTFTLHTDHAWEDGKCPACGEVCEHNFENGKCTICGMADPDAKDELKGHTISLGDKIAVNYYMILTEKTVNDGDAKMVFTVPDTGSTYTLQIPVSEAVKSGDFYVFTCEVAAKEMTSVIESKLVTSEGELTLKDYTVQDYAEVILSDTVKYAKEQELVKAMLNYGAQAQIYFNYNTDNLANDTEYMTEEEKAIKPYSFPPADVAYSITGEEAGVTYYGTALSLETELEFKHYFILDENVDAQSLEITCDYPVSFKKNGSLYELKISGIPAHKMAESSLKVTFGGVTLDYTIYSYGAKAYEAGKEELFTLVSALTHFANEATAYTFK